MNPYAVDTLDDTSKEFHYSGSFGVPQSSMDDEAYELVEPKQDKNQNKWSYALQSPDFVGEFDSDEDDEEDF